MLFKNKFSGDRLLRYLYYNRGRSVRGKFLFNKVFKKPKTNLEYLFIKNEILDLRNKEYLDATYFDLISIGTLSANILYTFDNTNVEIKIKQNGIEYYRNIEPRWWTKQLIGWIGGIIVGLTIGVIVEEWKWKHEMQSTSQQEHQIQSSLSEQQKKIPVLNNTTPNKNSDSLNNEKADSTIKY